MVRPFLSYVLASIILLSQTGLPVHMHYCKGMLESVSVFFSQGCDDHNEVSDLPACCKKTVTSSCSAEGSDCCDDKVSLLITDIVSSIPHFDKWDLAIPVTFFYFVPVLESMENISPITITGINTDSGPPIYLLHKSLIFYA
jgi:hypothetical protein